LQRLIATNIHAVNGIRTRNSSNEATAALNLRSHGHRVRVLEDTELHNHWICAEKRCHLWWS